MKFLKTLTLSISLLAPVVSQAYVLDTNTNVVTDAASGKEWLQWTETIGMSVMDDFSSFSGGGWRVASNADMAALFNDFFTTITWDADENTTLLDSPFTSYGDGIDQSYAFGTLFGWTSWDSSVRPYDGADYSGFYDDTLNITQALFGLDYDNDSRINFAQLTSEKSYTDEDTINSREYAGMYADAYFGVNFYDISFGVALIRDLSATPVSEPSTLALLGLGLAGLGVVRRKSKA